MRVKMVKINVPQQQYMKTLETGHGRTYILQQIDTNPFIGPNVFTINNMGDGILGLCIEYCLLVLWSVSIELVVVMVSFGVASKKKNLVSD